MVTDSPHGVFATSADSVSRGEGTPEVVKELQRELAVAWLRDKWGDDKSCPMCDNTTWLLSELGVLPAWVAPTEVDRGLWRGPPSQPWGYRCERCEHEWLPRDKDKEPRVCPKCKSPYWDTPRRAAKQGTQ